MVVVSDIGCLYFFSIVIISLLSLIGFVDTWFDFRKRFIPLLISTE